MAPTESEPRSEAKINGPVGVSLFGFYELLGAIFFFILLLTYFRWPLVELFSSHLLGGGGGDTNLYFWLVTTFPQSMLERGWFETNSFYPYKDTLAWSDNFLFPSLLFYLLNSILRLAEIPSWNVLILLAQLANATSVFLLAKTLRANFVTAILLGTIFLISPYYAEHLGHPQLQFFFFIPLGFRFLINLMNRPNWISAAGLAVTVFLCFVTTVYYAIGLVLICAIYSSVCFFNEKVIPRQLVIMVISSALATGMLLAPFILPYLGVKQLFGSRGLHEFYYFGLSALSFFSAAPISLPYEMSSNFSHNEAHFGWGAVVLFCLLIGLKQIWRISPIALTSILLSLILSDRMLVGLTNLNQEWRLYSAAMFSWLSLIILFYKLRSFKDVSTSLILAIVAVFFIAISIGPLGYPEIGIVALSPFRLFYEVFPGVDSLRAISRLGSIVVLVLTLSAIPFLNLKRIVSILLLPILVWESRLTAFPLAPLSPAPPIFAALPALIKKDNAVLISPLSGKLDKNNQVISWSELATINSQYLVALRETAPLLMNGYSGQRPRTIFDLPRIMHRFPSEAAVDKLLKFEKLQLVVVLGSKIEGFSETDFRKELSELSGKTRIVAQVDKDFIVELLRETTN